MSNAHPEYQWTVGPPIFTPGPKGAFDDIAVKDPSIVFFENQWHVFYTTKGDRTTHGGASTSTSLAYVAAPTLEGLNAAPRIHLNEGGHLCPKFLCAPQIFYFKPHAAWYLILQVPVPGLTAHQAIFMTNPDIADPNGWTRPEVFTFQRKLSVFWIDFWVICDETHAHLFYTDHDGRMFRQEAPLDKFPFGFGDEELAVEERGADARSPWRLHEASHIYRVRSTGKYLALLEAIRPHPLEPSYWDSRCRFMFAMEADTLRGPWRRIESEPNAFWGDPDGLFNEDGTPSAYGQVSHPEAIRCGYDELLEIENDSPDILVQAFDATGIGEDFRYDFLPWELALMRIRVGGTPR
jgi:glycosyl hydrolase family 62